MRLEDFFEITEGSKLGPTPYSNKLPLRRR
jgi:hypothetical protein